MVIPQSIFRAYDIRGIVGTELTETVYYRLGRALAFHLNELERDEVFLARDGRLSSASFSASLKQGLIDSGLHVIDLGIVATPILYYATHTQGIDSGLMVTGSHNPSNYNGIKMVVAGQTLTQQSIDHLYQLIQDNKQISATGRESHLSLLETYMQEIARDIVLERPLKVVVDCGNGAAGPIAPKMFARLGCEVISLYCDLDGHFPHHHPDPAVPANLLDLQAAVTANQADLGFAFDGDGDRLGLVTNTNDIIWPDRLMMRYAQEVLAQCPGERVVFDVKCSKHLREVIEACGGVPLMCPTGHSIVKAVMKESGAILAGEMSGHVFFKDRWYGFDDAIYSACRLLEMISQSPLSVSEQFARIPNSLSTAELKIPIPEEHKFQFMRDFMEYSVFPEGERITIDGLRLELANAWGLLRASNTSPCLIARFEASDQASLTGIQSLFKAQISRLDPKLVLTF
jgi:phosphomannomutase